jgi:hypothetical protein
MWSQGNFRQPNAESVKIAWTIGRLEQLGPPFLNIRNGGSTTHPLFIASVPKGRSPFCFSE